MSTENGPKPNQNHIDPQNVPEALHQLIPYAEKWGISDDVHREIAIDEASIEELREVVAAVSQVGNDINEWLGKPDIYSATKELISFVLLVDAYDLAKLRLESEKDK